MNELLTLSGDWPLSDLKTKNVNLQTIVNMQDALFPYSSNLQVISIGAFPMPSGKTKFKLAFGNASTTREEVDCVANQLAENNGVTNPIVGSSDFSGDRKKKLDFIELLS